MAKSSMRKSGGTGKKKTKAKLVVILGKSPGETSTREGRNAYGFEAQTRKCIQHFNEKIGKGKWEAVAWHHRELSARESKRWTKQLSSICAEAASQGATLAASNVCRLLRDRNNTSIMEDSGVALLMCDNEGIDATTAKGRHQLAAAENDCHLEAD